MSELPTANDPMNVLTARRDRVRDSAGYAKERLKAAQEEAAYAQATIDALARDELRLTLAINFLSTQPDQPHDR